MPRRVIGVMDRVRPPAPGAGRYESAEGARDCLRFMDQMAEKIRQKGFGAFLATPDSDVRPRNHVRRERYCLPPEQSHHKKKPR